MMHKGLPGAMSVICRGVVPAVPVRCQLGSPEIFVMDAPSLVSVFLVPPIQVFVQLIFLVLL
jgi:hypothetical protein